MSWIWGSLAAAGLAAGVPDAKKSPTVSVAVDPRIELLAVIHGLADPGGRLEGFDWGTSAYAAQVRVYFDRFRGHSAIEAYRKARSDGLTAVGAQQQILDLGPPPDLRRLRDTWSGPQVPLGELRSFAVESGFMSFYDEHAPAYRAFVKEAAKELEGLEIAVPLENYSSMKVTASATLILCPLRRGQQGNLNHIECLDGGASYRVVSTVGHDEVVDGNPVFRLRNRRWDLWHEMGHGLFDRLLEAYPGEVGRSSGLYDELPGGCHGSWDQCLREHVAQGVATRLLELDESAGDPGPHAHVPREGLDLLPLVKEQLKVFEARRGHFKTMADFFPTLLGAFVKRAGTTPRGGGAAREPRPVLPASSACGGRRGSEVRYGPQGPVGP